MTDQMNLTTPESLMQAYSALLNAGDLEGLVDLYEDTAVFEPEAGVVVAGKAAIRAALTELLAIDPTIKADVSQVLVADDIALVVNDWKLSGTAPDDSPVHQDGRSADVVRRQPDGRWLVAVDKP